VRSEPCLTWLFMVLFFANNLFEACFGRIVYIPLQLKTSLLGWCCCLNLLCKLGLHKWENYGDTVQIFWKEPGVIWGLETHSRVVNEKRRCLRCGVKFKRKLVPNPDGTMSCVGWASETGPKK
jgi:hypothetical protein